MEEALADNMERDGHLSAIRLNGAENARDNSSTSTRRSGNTG